MMAKGPVPKVSEVALRGIEPLVNSQVLTSFAAELPG
jgi:hypothetical protein